MNKPEIAHDTEASDARVSPTDDEVVKLLQETAQQYAECMRVADLADLSEINEAEPPRYAWDNPIGLVLAGEQYAKLV